MEKIEINRIIIFVFLWIGFPQKSFSQTKWSLQDKTIFNHYIKNSQLQKSENLFSYTIRYFLNTPYVANTLEMNQEEQLVINLHELDCVTYVENVLALMQTIPPKNSLSDFENHLTQWRYKNGQIAGYLSRLHYFLDWIQENQRKGILQNITSKKNGILFKTNVFFMSSNAQSILLKKYHRCVDSMKILEQKINEQSYFYIPKSALKNSLPEIKTGDIIAFTTNLEGLDIAHLGFALWEKNRLYIVHASSTQKKVVQNIFSNYLFSVKHFTGIILLRKIEFKNGSR